MRYILARANRRRLAIIAAKHSVLVFDYDGTLAPIVGSPAGARMRRRTRTLLVSLARSYPCAVITGRTIADISRRMSGISACCLVGNHGAEWEWSTSQADRLRSRVRSWRATLEASLGGAEGIVIEDKGLSLAIHYRHAAAPRAALEAIIEAVSRLRGRKVVDGKCVVNVIPSDAPHKGAALCQIRRMLGAQAAVYVGDDETDELAFSRRATRRLLTIRVGRNRASRAAYYVRSQQEVDSLLADLLALRRKAMKSPAQTLAARHLVAEARDHACNDKD